ncbi:MAG: potassium-transporting ATPase subunit C [Gemmatales bacterium]
MLRHLQIQLILVLATIILCSVIYPLVLVFIGQGLIPDRASGSLLYDGQGNVLGSRLIAQTTPGEEWFQPRPSAVDYNAAGSGGSNLGANNPKLRERVEKQLQALNYSRPVPADAVTTSGSGLDPHITLENALQQLPRIARAREVTPQKLEEFLKSRTVSVPLGGPMLINVLETNLALEKLYPRRNSR